MPAGWPGARSVAIVQQVAVLARGSGDRSRGAAGGTQGRGVPVVLYVPFDRLLERGKLDDVAAEVHSVFLRLPAVRVLPWLEHTGSGGGIEDSRHADPPRFLQLEFPVRRIDR